MISSLQFEKEKQMYGLPPNCKKSIQLLLSAAILFSLVFNSDVAAAASPADEAVESEDCQESLLLKGRELLEQVPGISDHFPGESSPETEPSEPGWFSPRLPNWLELPNWSLPSFESNIASNESESAGDTSGTDHKQELPQESSLASRLDSSEWVEKAEILLKSQGFEDTDGDGNLNWPKDSPILAGQNLDIVVVVTESSGVAIGFVPIAGDAVDFVALVVAKDPITGECLSKTDQLLFALSLLIVLPVSAKTLKLIFRSVGKSDINMPTVWTTLKGTLKKLKFETQTWSTRLDEGFEWTFKNVKSVNRLNRVPVKYWKFRVVAGRGATSSDELATTLGLSKFTDSNYREALIRFTGKSSDEVEGLEAHHILPKEFLEEFQNRGIDTIHDPRLLVWVDPSLHRNWSHEYGEAWRTFLVQNPNASQKEILENAMMLADKFGYRVLFRNSIWDVFRQLGRTFGG